VELIEPTYNNALKTALRIDLLVNKQVVMGLKPVEEMKPIIAKRLFGYFKLIDKRT
jgi:hypothetical protein